MVMEPEFALPCITAREVPLDAFVSSRYESLADMPPGAVVGTSSLRREMQIHAQYPFLGVTSLRGNLDTRLRKLDEGQYDAIILAAAGLTRLGLGERIRSVMPAEVSLPAAGQGALGIECLSARADVIRLAAAAGRCRHQRLCPRRARGRTRARRQLRGAAGRLRGDARGPAVAARLRRPSRRQHHRARRTRGRAGRGRGARPRARRRPAGAGRGSDPRRARLSGRQGRRAVTTPAAASDLRSVRPWRAHPGRHAPARAGRKPVRAHRGRGRAGAALSGDRGRAGARSDAAAGHRRPPRRVRSRLLRQPQRGRSRHARRSCRSAPGRPGCVSPPWARAASA